MPFSVKGYILEKPRVGAATSPFTSSPDNIILDSAAYNTAYPPNAEPNPRTEYMIFVEEDGNLPEARFAWSKNEGKGNLGFQRFDYEGMDQRFKLLPGGPLDIPKDSQGEPVTLGPGSNTTRISVLRPAIDDLSLFPMRISVGIGSGVTMTIQLVAADVDFGSPPPGTVQLSLDTGNLHWNTADLVTYEAQPVRLQRQTFFQLRDSKGRLGKVGDTILLNPLPRTGQLPLVRFGYGRSLLSIERVNEAALSANPTAGTVEWAMDTGLLKFNASDLTANAGQGIYYDGVTFARNLALASQSIGTMPAPLSYTGLFATNLPPPGGDLVIRAGSFQFEAFVRVTAFNDPLGKRGIVQILQTGSNAELRFSLFDCLALSGQTVTVTPGDLPIERGLALRLYRNPVNLGAVDPELKDVASVYEVQNAILASPIVSAPQVFLPAIPIDDSSATLNVRVDRGTGSFLGPLPRLDVGSPPAGFGYTLNLDQRLLNYARRRQNVITTLVQPTGAMSIGDPLVSPDNVLLELETGPGTGIYTPLALGTQAILEPTGGIVNFVDTDGELVLSGTGASIAGTLFADGDANFAGVVPGDVLLILSGTPKGLYIINAVSSPTSLVVDAPGGTAGALSYEIRRGREIVLDRYFEELILADPATRIDRLRKLGTVTNSPRYTVPLSEVGRTGFRFGTSTFATATVVPNDLAFTAPASLAAGAVEVSEATGNVNFSQADVTGGGDVFHALRLLQQIDYRISGQLGFIEFTQRAIEFDEAYITYKSGTTSAVTTEQITWQIHKEVVVDHPTPTNILSFNPTNRRIAPLPKPAVFRGGRPQVVGTQCLVHSGPPSTIEFLPDDIISDALPHGAIVGPTERVYIDYFIFEAMPGDRTATVLSPPIDMVDLVIAEGDTSFKLNGDWTQVFKANHLLRIEQEEVYILGASSYDSGANETTVNLVAPQVFASDYTNPKVYQSSGPVPFLSSPGQPSYFAAEGAPYDPVPRGSNKMLVEGDRTAFYKTGAVLAFSNGGATFLDLYLVTGAAYKPDIDRTEVTVARNLLRQCTMTGGQILYHSVRPIVDSAMAPGRTLRPPVTTQPVVVYRKKIGEKGVLLVSPTEYTLDDSGELKLKTPLARNEEFGILYTGNTIIEAGRNLRATYTHTVVPNEINGMANQVLLMDYDLYAPDTWFFRVETITNFKSELTRQYEAQAKAGTPSGGPNTSNMTQPKLHEQGRPSVYFDEGRYFNEDIIARASLKWYNDTINLLEDVLQDVDGRVVGNNDGRFKFDGNLNPAGVDPPDATNQIDDLVKVSEAPYNIAFSAGTFTATSVGTYQKIYAPSPYSRFYPTEKFVYGVAPQLEETGDIVLDLKVRVGTAVTGIFAPVTGAVALQTRPAYALILYDAPAGATSISVDNALGSATEVRPAFLPQMKCYIQFRDKTFLGGIIPVEMTVSSVSANGITFTTALPAAVPAGSTIFRTSTDPSNASVTPQPIATQMVQYTVPSFFLDAERGHILYFKPYPPFGDEPIVKQIPSGQPLQCRVQFPNSLTAPLRIPALDGLPFDDDGTVSFPIQSPTFEAEVISSTVLPPVGGGYALNEYNIIKAGGTLRAVTQAPYVGTGSLDAPLTTITATAAFPAPVPEAHDLVRITSGANAASAYRRVVSTTANSVTVDVPFDFSDAGFQFTVTVSNALESGTTATASLVGTVLTDTGANFFGSGVQAGHTVVFTSGLLAGDRFQVVAVPSSTILILHAIPSVLPTNVDYRVDNPLNTYGGPTSLFDLLTISVQGQLDVLSVNMPPSKPYNERTALELTFEQVFENVVGPRPGSASGTTLVDAGANFVTASANTSHLVYIRNGAAQGIYKIASVDSQSQLTVDPAFPGADPAASYRVVSTFGMTYLTLSELYDKLEEIDAYVTSVPPFLAKLGQAQVVKPGPVPDTVAFANTLTIADLDAREPVVAARVNAINDPNSIVGKVQNALTGTDKLYDCRYVWVDTRINFEKGLTVLYNQSIEARNKALADIVKQLTKLLTVS